MPDADAMRRADASAAEQRGAVGDPVASCPAPDRFAIEACVIGEDGKPLRDQAIELTNAGGGCLRTMTDAEGLARFIGLDPAGYAISLYRLDRDAWRAVDSEALPEDRAKSEARSMFAARPDDGHDAIEHVAQEGDCLASIADRYGFFPDTVWKDGANAALRAERDPNVLRVGDRVHVPAKRYASVDVTVGQLVVLRRLGVPAVFNARFTHHDGAPRAGIAYHLSIASANGDPALDETGETDSAGAVSAPIPPDAVRATVTLHHRDREEAYVFELGHMPPIDDVGGIQSRLASLGCYDGALDDEFGGQTRAAIEAFERARGLDVTGEATDALRAALVEAHGS